MSDKPSTSKFLLSPPTYEEAIKVDPGIGPKRLTIQEYQARQVRRQDAERLVFPKPENLRPGKQTRGGLEQQLAKRRMFLKQKKEVMTSDPDKLPDYQKYTQVCNECEAVEAQLRKLSAERKLRKKDAQRKN